MTVTTKEQAWAEANKIFPTDYDKDYASSERAGYDIYRHRELNYYSRICDLGDRLEVITGEWGENTVNIWIVEQADENSEIPSATAEEMQEYRQCNEDCKVAGSQAQCIINERVQRVTIVVSGACYDNEESKRTYDRLTQADEFRAKSVAGDVVVAWCEANGIAWGSISDYRLQHVKHGTKGQGHVCITAIVTERVK